MNLVFNLMLGYFLGWGVSKLVAYGAYKYYNRAMYKVGDVLIPKNMKMEKWENTTKVTVKIEDVGQLCYKIVYQALGQDVLAETKPFYWVNLNFIRDAEQIKKPTLTLIKS